MNFPFDNTFAALPEQFYARLDPVPVKSPKLVRVNDSLVDLLGGEAEAMGTAEGVEALAGVRVPEGATPIAMAYAGHQFGGWVPQLGDGRAILLGETVGRDGVRRDIQLKGSGRTPFSRGGDGRAALGPVLREYVVSEAMAALGLPTTRALAAVTTGEEVFRETPLPGAILTRVAQSHVRVGTFQYHYARKDFEALRSLADYVIQRHYPEAAEAPNPYRALLEAVVARQASLVARWMQIGFIHGVMNTDNTSIVGETIDFGPCAFMDTFHPDTVFSSIDHMGRYAWANQPNIAYWNLSQLAQTFVPLMDDDEKKATAEGQEAIDTFPELFARAHFEGFGRKLGFLTNREGDEKFIEETLGYLASERVDFTLFFRHLTKAAEEGGSEALNALFSGQEAFAEWFAGWQERVSLEGATAQDVKDSMGTVNPVFIPRNHRVEQMIEAAYAGDFEPFERLLAVLSTPYTEQPENAAYEMPPQPEEVVHWTYCGT